jgi:hypothetical protein
MVVASRGCFQELEECICVSCLPSWREETKATID